MDKINQEQINKLLSDHPGEYACDQVASAIHALISSGEMNHATFREYIRRVWNLAWRCGEEQAKFDQPPRTWD